MQGTLFFFRFQTSDEESESELCIDVENVMNTDSGVNDIDGPCIQTTATTFPCSTCSVDFKTKDELTSHTAECSKQGLWTSDVFI